MLQFSPASRSERSHYVRCQVLAALIGMVLHAPTLAQRYAESEPAASRDTYFWIKREASKSFNRIFSDLTIPKREPFDLALLRLNWMDSESTFSMHGVTRNELLALLAFNVVSLKEVLTRAGYPKSAWGDDLIVFEDKFMRIIQSRPRAIDAMRACVLKKSPNGQRFFEDQIRRPYRDLLDYEPGPERDIALALNECEADSPVISSMEADYQRLLTRLTKYQQLHQAEVPAIEGSKEIGGTTPATVKIAWQPSSGALRIIPTFFYQLCEMRRVDPQDPSQCGDWKDILGDELSGAGNYRFFAKWPDGRTRSGEISVTFENDGKRWIIAP